MELKEAIHQADVVMAEKQRMATLEAVTSMCLKLEEGMSPQNAAAEALEDIWAQRGLDKPESGWNPDD